MNSGCNDMLKHMQYQIAVGYVEQDFIQEFLKNERPINSGSGQSTAAILLLRTMKCSIRVGQVHQTSCPRRHHTLQGLDFSRQNHQRILDELFSMDANDKARRNACHASDRPHSTIFEKV